MSEWLDQFGGSSLATAAFWTLAALVLLAGTLILLRIIRNLSSSGTFIAGGRNRVPRLAVVDAAAVDNQRRLVLVRRDNVEHLILIGGPTDIVVEQSIKVLPAGTTAQATAPIQVPKPSTQGRTASVGSGTAQQTVRTEPQLSHGSPSLTAEARPSAASHAPTRRAHAATEQPSQAAENPDAQAQIRREPPKLRQEASKPPAASASVSNSERSAPVSVPQPEVHVEPSSMQHADTQSGGQPASLAKTAPNPRREVSLEEEMSRLLDDLADERRKED